MARPVAQKESYQGNGIQVTTQDLKELLAQFRDVAEAPPQGMEVVKVSTSVEAVIKRGSTVETRTTDDIDSLLDRRRTPPSFRDFSLEVNATYKGRDEKGPFQFTRRMVLDVPEDEQPEFTISAEQDRIVVVQDYVRGLFEDKERTTWPQKTSLWVSFWIIPIAILILLAARFHVDSLTVVAVFWGLGGVVGLLIAMEKLFPPSLWVVRADGSATPWLVSRSNELLAALGVALVVAILLYLTPFR